MTAMVGSSHLLTTPGAGALRASSDAKGGDDGAFAQTVGSISDRIPGKGGGQADAGRRAPVDEADDAREPREGKPGIEPQDSTSVEPQPAGVDLLVLVSDSAMKRNESGKSAENTSGKAGSKIPPDDVSAAPSDGETVHEPPSREVPAAAGEDETATSPQLSASRELPDAGAHQAAGAEPLEVQPVARFGADSATPLKARPDLAAMLAQGGALAGQRAAIPTTGDPLRPGKGPDMAAGDGVLAADNDVEKLFRFARADGTFETFRPADAARDGSRAPVTPEALVRHPGLADRAAKPGAAVFDGRAADARESRGGDKGIMGEVAVLETKKFLGVGLAQTATAAVVSAVTENPEWNAMLRETAATSASILNGAKNASTSLKIQLSPAELGMVTATFKLSGGHMTIELKVETIEAYRQLSEDNSGMARALRGHGYDVEQITIQHVASDRVQTLSGASAVQGGGQAEQAAGDGRFAQSGRERGDQGGDQGGSQRNWGQPQGDGRRGEGDARPGDGRAAGGVYL